MDIKPGKLLQHINSPADLKKLSREQLHEVCDELRQYIVDTVAVSRMAAILGPAWE